MAQDKVRRADQIDIDLMLCGDALQPSIRRDLALDALAEIQALDAQPIAEDFRATWLSGTPLKTGRQREWRDGASTEAIDALHAAEERLLELYAWNRNQATAFLLEGRTPTFDLIEVHYNRTSPGAPGNPAASAFTNRIALVIRPQATKKEVADAYDRIRRVFLQRSGVEVGERNRATSSERTRHLAVLGYRIWRGDFESWRDAFDTYEADQPEDAAEYRSKSTGEVWIKTFRRDTRNAYERVTGCDLVWQPGVTNPKKEGGETDGNETK